MATIWKYDVPTDQSFTLKIPAGSQVLCVQVQHNSPRIWVLVHAPNAPEDTRRFVVVGTGADVPNSLALAYVGTFQMVGGSLVFHLFEDHT